jgi:von Willebrand factor type A domain
MNRISFASRACTQVPRIIDAISPLVVVTLLVVGLISLAQSARADNYVVVVFDDSGSMKQVMPDRVLRIDAAKQALTSVLSQLPAKTVVGVLALNTRIDGSAWIVPVGNLESTRWQERVAAIGANGGTPLGQFLKDGADALLKLRANDRFGTFRLLVVTDGEATDANLLRTYLPDVLSRGITLDVIGVSMAGQHSLATLSHSYRKADDVQSLTTALTDVFAETASDNQAAADDFQLLEGLPDGFAEEVLKSMSTIRNDPIQASDGGNENEKVGNARNIPPARSQNSIVDLFVGSLCCCGGIFAIFCFTIVFFGFTRGKRK